MSSRRALLWAGLALSLSVGCEAERPSRTRPPDPLATYARTILFHADGSSTLDGVVVVTLASDALERSYTFDDVRLAEPGDAHRWVVDEATSNAPWPVTLGAGAHTAQRLITFTAHVAPNVGAPDTSTVPIAPPSTLELVLRPLGLDDEGPPLVVLPDLVEDTKLTDPCPPPSLEGMFDGFGATLDWSASTLPGLVQAPTSLSADPLGRAYLLATYPNALGSSDSRVFAAKGGLIGSITEVASPLVALAPGEGAGPTLALHDLSDPEQHAVVVTRRGAGLAEIWNHTIATTPGLLVPAVATSGGRVLVGLTIAPPLVVDGVEVAGADADASQLLLFDADTGALVATKGGVDAGAAVGLVGGAFAVTDGFGMLRVLGMDLEEKWAVSTEGPMAASPDGGVWTVMNGNVVAYNAAGDAIAGFPGAAGATLAPLPDGSVLVGSPMGLARGTTDGIITEVSLPFAPVGWCSARPEFLVAPVAGGAVIAARVATPQDGASPGRAVIARLGVLP